MSVKNKVLAVDDNPTNILLYEELLEEQYELLTAESGEEALVTLQSFQPDVVLLDIMMPGISGYAVCEEIRKIPGFGSDTKVILVSAKNTTADRLVGYEAGADDYLIKPFDEDELEAKLKIFLKLKSMEEVDRLKSNMMALFSHETRTPLNGILGPLQLLQTNNDSNTPEERLSWLKMISESAYNLQTLVEKVLLLSSLRSGQRLLNREAVVSSEILNYVLYNVQRLSESKGVVIELKAEQSTTLIIDRDLMLRCLVSILNNAVDLNEAGSKLELSGEIDNADYVISVSGQGKGVDPKVLADLISGICEVNQNEDISGQSLNLSIAHEVAQLHHGRVSATSTADKGTTFKVSLPLAA